VELGTLEEKVLGMRVQGRSGRFGGKAKGLPDQAATTEFRRGKP
jgi:hypothetical protein